MILAFQSSAVTFDTGHVMKTLLLLPFFWYTLWHGWLLPLPSWAPPEYPIIAKEEKFYRARDPEGYLRFLEVTRMYRIPILAPDKGSSWFKALPDFMQGSGMMVWDAPTIWVNNWDLQSTDPGMTISVIEHELVHVLSRWYPEELVKREGMAPPGVDITNWRTWAEQEIFAANVQLRVAQRMGSAAGVQFALDIAAAQWGDMSPERRQRFLATYGQWLNPEITNLAWR